MVSTYKNILVAVDGSDSAKKAFKKSIDIALNNGASLILTHVMDTRGYAIIENYDNSFSKKLENQVQELLDSYEKIAKDAGVTNIKKVIEYGSPRSIIVKTIIPREQADLIIVGATGLNRVERLVVGSVSESITRHATCDVLIIR